MATTTSNIGVMSWPSHSTSYYHITKSTLSFPSSSSSSSSLAVIKLNTFSPLKTNQNLNNPKRQHKSRPICSLRVPISTSIQLPALASSTSSIHDIAQNHSHSRDFLQTLLVVMDLDPQTAKVAIGLLGPFLSAFSFLFILRIVMSWYPKLPVNKFPYVIAYAPTEPLLVPTRKVIPPLGGVDVTPVVWFALISFLNEILLGPQGLLVLLSQQV